MKPALLIIDMQNAFLSGYIEKSMNLAAQTINQAIKSFKDKNYPIIWVQDVNEKEGAIPGTEEFNIISALNTNMDDMCVHKQNLNAFIETECANILTRNNIDVVIVSGFCADYCVVATYKGAIKEGFAAAILKEGTAAGSQADIDRINLENETISLSVLQKM